MILTILSNSDLEIELNPDPVTSRIKPSSLTFVRSLDVLIDLIFVPSNHAKEFAKENHHCITLYTVAPDTLKESSWSEKKEEYAQKLISLAEEHLPNLSKHIKEIKIMTPEDYRVMTHMKKSSFGGNVPIWNQKTPTHFTPVENLLFLGQQSENGGGMCAVMMGAKDAFNKTKFK